MSDSTPTHYRPNPQVLFTELDDGTGVLLDLESKFYYTLNATGVAVWKALTKGAASSISALATRVEEEFSVDEDTARADVEAFVSSMLEGGLVTASKD